MLCALRLWVSFVRPCPGHPSAREFPLRPSFVSLLPGPAAPRRAALLRPRAIGRARRMARAPLRVKSGCYRSVVPSVQFVCSSCPPGFASGVLCTALAACLGRACSHPPLSVSVWLRERALSTASRRVLTDLPFFAAPNARCDLAEMQAPACRLCPRWHWRGALALALAARTSVRSP